MFRSRIQLGLLLGIAGAAAVVSAATKPPSLVLIVTDDQGYADVGFNGCTDIPTPHIDRIAAEGVRCTAGYVTHSVCGPSRAAIVTGRYQCRFGASRNPTVNPETPNNGVPLSERTIAEMLRPLGYRSMIVGKWHLGTHPDLRPLRRGFDEFFGFLTGGHNYFPEQLTLRDFSEVTAPWAWYRMKLLRGEQRVETTHYLTDELSDAAVDFVERSHEQPFFLYLAYNAPHAPLQATTKYLDRFPHIADEKRKTYAAMVSAVDDGVGRLLAKLAEHDLDRDTLVVFLSDNGGPVNNGSSNRPLRGHKGSPFEGGVRVPFALRWVGTLPQGVDYDLPVSSLDIAATIVARSGAQAAADKPLDGVDLVPYLTGETNQPPHTELYWRWYDQQRYAVRSGDDKLILISQADDKMAAESQMLYDVRTDIGEQVNRYDENNDVVSNTRRLLERWRQELVDPIAPGLGTWIKGDHWGAGE